MPSRELRLVDIFFARLLGRLLIKREEKFSHAPVA